MPEPGEVLIGSGTGECTPRGVGVNYRTLEESKNYLVENRDGKVYFEISDETTSLNLFCDTLLPSDVQIEIDTEYVTGPDDFSVGLHCRVNVNPSRWYMLAARSDGSWKIYKYVFGSGYGLLAEGESTAINVGKANNHLTAVCEGDLLSFYINDIEVGSVRDSEFNDGKPGWSLLTFDQGGVGVAYDNFVVSMPDPNNPPGGAATHVLTPEPGTSSSDDCQILSITPVTGLTDPFSGEEIPSYDYVAEGFISNEYLSVKLESDNTSMDVEHADDQGRIAGNITWGVLGTIYTPPKEMTFSIEGEKCTLSQTVTWP